jgi:hypothetical protein
MFIYIYFRARLTIEVEDQTDYVVFDGYDHVMLGLDSVGSIEKVITHLFL